MTSARKRAEVDAELRETIGYVLRCISADGLVAFPGWETASGESRVLRFRSERSRLRQTDGSRLFLYVELVYIVVEDETGRPRVRTVSYVYTIFDAREQRILSWHHHPAGRSDETVRIPHIHIYVETSVGARTLSKLHLPSGHVGLEDVVAFLIQEMDVEPREQYRRLERGEPRWRGILQEGASALVRRENGS